MAFPQPPFQSNIDDYSGRVSSVWQSWLTRVQSVLNAVTSSGATSNRPTQNLYAGQLFFDTALNIPIWWNGAAWVNASGVVV